jgi:hypothetical protein
MLGSAFISFLLFPLLAASSDVRLLDAAGSFSNVGLLQVRMDNDFGTVCGANAAAADVIDTHTHTHLYIHRRAMMTQGRRMCW